MNNLKDKVILITGAGKGSGRVLAKAFANRGAMVAANDISPVNVDEVVDEINRQGGRATAYIEAVAKKLGAQNLIKQVEDEFGRIDILINHASVQPHVALLDMDEWDWLHRQQCHCRDMGARKWWKTPAFILKYVETYLKGLMASQPVVCPAAMLLVQI